MRHALLVILALTLAGCSSGDEPVPPSVTPSAADDAASDKATETKAPEETTDAAPNATAVPKTTRYEGTVSGVWTGGQVNKSQGTWAPVDFSVPRDATGLLVELVW